MEPEVSLPHSQASATRPYPGPAQSSPTHFEIFSILLLLALRPKHLRQHPILEYHQRIAYIPTSASYHVRTR